MFICIQITVTYRPKGPSVVISFVLYHIVNQNVFHSSHVNKHYLLLPNNLEFGQSVCVDHLILQTRLPDRFHGNPWPNNIDNLVVTLYSK